MSALRLINETEVASGVTSVNITDVFSADFDIYKITASTVGNSTTAFNANVRLINSSGSVITASNYDYAYLLQKTDTVFAEGRATNQNNMIALFGTSEQYPKGSQATTYFFNPYSSSSYTFSIAQNFTSYSTLYRVFKYISVLKQTTSCTGFNAYVSASAFGTGTVFRTYGLRVDNG